MAFSGAYHASLHDRATHEPQIFLNLISVLCFLQSVFLQKITHISEHIVAQSEEFITLFTRIMIRHFHLI
jgi:hypothetical protein